MGPHRGSEHPESCAIVRLETTAIYDINKPGLFISQGTTEKPWEEKREEMPGIVAMAGKGLCQHLTQYSTLYFSSKKLL